MRHLLFTFFLLIIGSLTSFAQTQDDTPYATVHLLNWPPALYENTTQDDGALYPYDLLASLDRLTLGYAYAVEDDLPTLDVSLTWTPGPHGVYNDQRVRYEDLPGEVVIAAVDLSAEVVVDGAVVAEMVVSLDSLVLGPSPKTFYLTERDIAWGSLFTNTSAEDARTYLVSGFELHNLEILRIAFASYEDEQVAGYEPPYPADIGVYPPRIGIWVGWLGGGRSGSKRGTTTKPRTPREGIGRTVPTTDDSGRTRDGTRRTPTTDGDTDNRRTDRTASSDREGEVSNRDKAKEATRSGKTKKKKDEEEDDDEDFLPGALVGVAAIGAVAYAGGTVGIFGNTDAPVGLTAGMVQGKGGVLLQGAINEAVLGEKGKPEQAIARIMSFYDAFNAPIRPALSLGVLLEENGDEIDLSPSVSLGAVGVFGPVLFFGGYDVTLGSVDFGMAFNFRHKQR